MAGSYLILGGIVDTRATHSKFSDVYVIILVLLVMLSSILFYINNNQGSMLKHTTKSKLLIQKLYSNRFQ